MAENRCCDILGIGDGMQLFGFVQLLSFGIIFVVVRLVKNCLKMIMTVWNFKVQLILSCSLSLAQLSPSLFFSSEYLCCVGEGDEDVHQVSADPACHGDVCDQWLHILLRGIVLDYL